MATNFDLVSSSASDSSLSDDENSIRKLDLSFHELDTKTLEANLQELYSDTREAAWRVERVLLYNNRIEMFPPSLNYLINLTVLDMSNNSLLHIPGKNFKTDKILLQS